MAIYVYDPVGNMLQIIRGAFPDPAARVGISAFTPAKGAIGTTVTVFGRGFDQSPLQNTLTFNGTPATVTAASPTQLTATVPAGATTGPITVAVLPVGTGTSAQAFTVLVVPTLTPISLALYPKEAATFTASQPAQWRVSGAVGGNASVGTITPTGTTATYTAPAAPPPGGLVTVTAANPDDLNLQATATVEIIPGTEGRRSPLVSVARGPALGPTLVSVARAPGIVLPPAVSVARAPTAAPFEAPLVAVAREPVVTAVAPAQVPRGTTNQAVILSGAGFAGTTAVAFVNLGGGSDPNISATIVSVDSITQITAAVTIASGAAPGFRVARVTAAGVTSTVQATGANVLEVLP